MVACQPDIISHRHFWHHRFHKCLLFSTEADIFSLGQGNSQFDAFLWGGNGNNKGLADALLMMVNEIRKCGTGLERIFDWTGSLMRCIQEEEMVALALCNYSKMIHALWRKLYCIQKDGV